MISVKEAKSIISEKITPTQSQSVSLEHAIGQTLSKDLLAPFDQPRFDNSAMDGFAVQHQLLKDATEQCPVELKIEGEMAAGASDSQRLSQGAAMPIMTGSQIPEGADAVLRVEDTSGFESPGKVKCFKSVRAGENIRLKGEEVQANEPIIKKGSLITPAELGILATFGFSSVDVAQPPKIGLITTGSELLEPGKALENGKIYNSNRYVLGSLLQRSGAELTMAQSVQDISQQMNQAFELAFQSCDIILTSGGVSEGKYDLVEPMLSALGVETLFTRVAQKPGMPFYFGHAGHKLVFGLPGNPVSAMINAMVYVVPVIQKMLGRSNTMHTVQAQLTEVFKPEKKKHRFLFGQISIENGKLYTLPTKRLGSHMLTAAQGCNAILESPAGMEPLQKGEMITCTPINW
jgi:molybdopterin molybdotransferase